jgi:hypothetical protein
MAMAPGTAETTLYVPDVVAKAINLWTAILKKSASIVTDIIQHRQRNVQGGRLRNVSNSLKWNAAFLFQRPANLCSKQGHELPLLLWHQTLLQQGSLSPEAYKRKQMSHGLTE